MEYKCLICGEEFQTRYLLRKHRDLTRHLAKGKHPIYICECKFCKRQFNRKFSKTLHEKTCLLNPERKNVKRHKVSEETKKKISNGMKKAHKEGRANEWQGRTKRNYAEQSWYNIFSNDIREKTFVNNYFVKNIGLILPGLIRKYILKLMEEHILQKAEFCMIRKEQNFF